MNQSNQEPSVFRVKFFEKDQKNPVEALVRYVEPSDFPGLVCFREFIFRDQTDRIIMPGDEEAGKRFRGTRSLHIPYHNILYIEEVEDRKPDLKNLPFLRMENTGAGKETTPATVPTPDPEALRPRPVSDRPLES